MKCEKCQDRGFTEEEHGLVMILCDCERGNELRKDIMGDIPEDDNSSRTEPQMGGSLNDPELEIVSRIEQADKPARSRDTGKPKQRKKRKKSQKS